MHIREIENSRIHGEREMQELQAHELEQVGGGIAFLLPLGVALLDTSAYTTMGMAFGAGYAAGEAMMGMSGHQCEDLTNYNLF